MEDLISRQALLHDIDGIRDCNDMVWENDTCPREAVCSLCRWGDTKDYIRRMIANAPSADRPTGRWIINSAGRFRCSVCGEPDKCWVVPTKYCPNCGAKMGGA